MSDWIVPLTQNPAAPIRIVCLPHPGGGARFYQPWASATGADILAIQPPGRESRAGQSPITDLARLVRLTAGVLASTADSRPTMLFGHSGGAIYAFEVCKALERAGRGPARLAVSAIPPPDHQYWAGTVESLLADPAGAYRKLGAGALPGELEGDPAMLSAFVALIRADARLYSGIGLRSPQRLTCPISAFSGEDDAIAPPDAMHGWHAWAAEDTTFKLHRHPGDHFYIRRQFPAIMADLLAATRSGPAADPTTSQPAS